MSTTIEQERSRAAYESIARAIEAGAVSRDLARLTADLPIMVRSLGLGQAATILKRMSDKDLAARGLLDALTRWLCQERALLGTVPTNLDLAAAIRASEDMLKYRQAKIEALAYLKWVKLFAKAEARGQA